jgi:hypothetical protein
MTNDEIRKNDEARMTTRTFLKNIAADFQSENFVIRHSSFVIPR